MCRKMTQYPFLQPHRHMESTLSGQVCRSLPKSDLTVSVEGRTQRGILARFVCLKLLDVGTKSTACIPPSREKRRRASVLPVAADILCARKRGRVKHRATGSPPKCLAFQTATQRGRYSRLQMMYKYVQPGASGRRAWRLTIGVPERLCCIGVLHDKFHLAVISVHP